MGSSVDASVKTLPILITTQFSLTGYHVGDSLVEDSGMFNPSTVALAHDSGTTWQADFHVSHGADLQFIVANPSTWNEVFPSQWNVALPAVTFDYVTVEPYIGDTIGGETTAARTLIGTAQTGPSGTTAGIFILETWPQTTAYGADYTTYWLAPVVDSDGTAYTQQLGATNAVYERLTATYGSGVYVVPCGSVFSALNQAIQAGQITGMTNVSQFYRDATHLGAVGRFVANVTSFATYFRIRPNASHATIALYAADASGGIPLTDALAAQLEAMVWQVVSTDPRAIH